MRVLLVNDYGTPTGGAELMALDLREGLRQRGHDARFFASSARCGPAPNLADYRCLGTTSSLRTLLQVANPWAWRHLHQVLAEFRPDVVHVRIFLTQLSPLILPLIRGIPSVHHVVWYRAVCPVGTKMLPDGLPCRLHWGRACYRHGCLPLRDWPPLMFQMALWWRWRTAFDRVITISEAMRTLLVAEGISPVALVPNAVPERPPRPSLAAPPLVAFAGRLVWEKGADVLLRAFARVARQVPEARLLLVGDGPERASLERLVVELGLADSVVMPGHLSRQEMERQFSAAWVQAVPSRWAEPFGLVAAEALMRGTPVVASGSGGLSEIVEEGRTGLLVPPDDDQALAEALVRLLCDRARAEEMGWAGRETALARYGQAAYLDALLRIYDELLQAGGRRHSYG